MQHRIDPARAPTGRATRRREHREEVGAECLQCPGTERDDHFGPETRDLSSQKWPTGVGGGRREPVRGGPAFEHIHDGDRFRTQAQPGDRTVELLARSADERKSSPILLSPRRFAHEQHARVKAPAVYDHMTP
jgi:hypothetical protein